jgi:hypothetical protein
MEQEQNFTASLLLLALLGKFRVICCAANLGRKNQDSPQKTNNTKSPYIAPLLPIGRRDVPPERLYKVRAST